MKKSLIILIALIFSISGYANSNGYMGLNVGLKYSASLPAGIFNPKYKFVVGHDAEIEYTFKKNWSVVGIYELFKANIETISEINSFSDEFDTRKQTLNFTSHKIGFSFRKYPKKRVSIAPLGNYFGIGAGIILPHEANLSISFNTETNLSSESYTENQYTDFYIGFEAGRQYVIFDRMLIDVGMRIHLPLLTMYGNTTSSSNAPLSVNVFQVHVGIGSLLW